jgi:hypothetical protein
MQAMLDHDAQNRGHGGASRLPVLFHLMDVSRLRPPAEQPAATDAATQGEPAESVSNIDIAQEDKEVAIPQSSSHFGTLPSSPHAAPLGLAAAPPFPVSFEPSPAIGSTLEHTSQPPAPAVLPPVRLDAAITAPNIEANSSTVSTAADPPSAIVEATIVGEPAARPMEPIAAPVERSNRRQGKRAASEDWFASHGKFIAIAFVLALLGTIYFARTHRQQPAANTEKQLASTESTEPGQKSYDSRPVDRTSGYRLTSTSTGESRAAQSESTAGKDPMTELHPPTTPRVAADDAGGEKSSKSDNLFVFPTKKGEDRMAVRPETATSPASAIQNSTSPQAASPGSSPPSTSPSAGGKSEFTPAYPTTSQPLGPQANSFTAGAYPVTGAPPLGAAAAPSPPSMNSTNQTQGTGSPAYSPPSYRGQYPGTGYSPPAGQAWLPQGPAAGAAIPYQPSDNTARGPRYERTGSGNY